MVNGPNLNLLGEREPAIYGRISLEEIETRLSNIAQEAGFAFLAMQSNSEGTILDFLHKHRRSAQGLVINPGAFSHYSYAIRDCISAIAVPTIEVHISNIYNREEFRHKSVVSPVCIGQITGLGRYGYELAMVGLISIIAGREDTNENRIT